MDIELEELLRRVPTSVAKCIRAQIGAAADAAKPKRRKYGNVPT